MRIIYEKSGVKSSQFCIFPDGNTRISKLPTSIVNESIDLNVSRYRKEVPGMIYSVLVFYLSNKTSK